MPPFPDKKPLLAILDGHGIIHCAYYALKDTPLVARHARSLDVR